MVISLRRIQMTISLTGGAGIFAALRITLSISAAPSVTQKSYILLMIMARPYISSLGFSATTPTNLFKRIVGMTIGFLSKRRISRLF